MVLVFAGSVTKFYKYYLILKNKTEINIYMFYDLYIYLIKSACFLSVKELYGLGSNYIYIFGEKVRATGRYTSLFPLTAISQSTTYINVTNYFVGS